MVALHGDELLQVQGVQANGQPAATTFQTTTGAIAALASTETSFTATNITTVGNGTLTAAGLVGGEIVRSGPVAAFSDATDTAVAIVAALPGGVAAGSVNTYIKNTTAFTQTITAGAGVTLPTTVIIPPFSVAKYVMQITSATAVTFLHIYTVPISVGGSATDPTAVALTTVGAGIITAAGFAGGITARTGPTVAFTDTTDTAAAIIAASANLVGKIGAAFIYYYSNQTPFLATITGGTGVTVSGITTVPANTVATYLITYTAAATITMVGLEASSLLSTSLALAGSTSGQTILVPNAIAGYGTMTLPVNTTTLAGLAIAQTWTQPQTFTNSDILLLGSSTGATTLTSDNAGASNFTYHLPAVSDTVVLGKSAFSNTAITFVSSIALQQVPGLFVQLVTSGTYMIDCYLPVNTVTAAAGIAVALSASNSLTATAFSVAAQFSNTTGGGGLYATKTTATLGNTMSSTTLCVLARLTGAINVNTGGTLIVTAAQAGSTADTTTIVAGGYLSVTRILNNGV